MQRLVQTGQKQLVALSLGGIAVIGAYLLGLAIVEEDYTTLAVSLAYGIGGFLAIFILREWRLGVALFFAWAVFEDLLRKFLGNNMAVYATKDLIILTAYASFLLAAAQRRERVLKNPLGLPLLLFVIWVFIETLNPYLENYLVPLLGLRMSLFYIPMLYLGYSFVKKEQQLRHFWFLMLGIAALTSGLGIVQSIVGLEFLNPESAPNLRLFLTRYAPGSGAAVPRPTSTFVDAGRFAQYMMVMAYVGLGIVAYFYNTASTKRVTRSLAWASWIIIIIGLFLSGQRIAIVLLALSLVGLSLVWLMMRQQIRLRSGRPFPLGRVLLAGAAVLVLGLAVAPERFESALRFYTETIDPSSPYTEFQSRPQTYIRLLSIAWEESQWLGHGTGSSSLGRQYVMPLLPEREAHKFLPQVEGGYAVVLWEWGIVGLVLWLWWSLLLLKLMIQVVWKLRTTRFFWLAITLAMCIFVVLFPSFFLGMQIYQNYLTQAFLWFLIGMLFQLREMPATESAPAVRAYTHPMVFAAGR